MKSRHIIFVILVVGLIFFLLFKKSTKKNSTEIEDDELSAPTAAVNVTSAAPVNSAVSGDKTAALQPGASFPAVDEAAAKKFSETLGQMGKCLGLTNMLAASEKVDPVPDNLIGSLRSSLGEAVVQMEDWSQTEVVERNGTVKRIRVDFDYPDGATPVRRLSMFTINSYGAAELVELTDAESNNPNEAYVQSLSEGLKINADEKSGRVYFSQGEELIFTVKNGKIQNFSVSRGNKNYSCAELDTEAPNCFCP